MRLLTCRAVLACSFVVSILFSAACGTVSQPEAKVFASGEKAQFDRVSFSVVDSQTLPKLDDGTEGRVPTNRFYVMQIAAFNGGNADYTVPTLSLVDDSGQSYPELADGRGVPRWVGVSRKLSPGETLQGSVAFDAPVKHYKLLVSGELADAPVYVDIPVSFVHERNEFTAPSASTQVQQRGDVLPPDATKTRK